MKMYNNAIYHNPMLTIKCYKDSTAYKYAVNNRIKSNVIGETSAFCTIKGLKIKQASDSIQLSWNRDEKVKGYIIDLLHIL